MSQFKSRVPSGLVFTTKEVNDQGYCCSNSGDGTYSTSTRYECFLKNGFFVLSDPDNNCPKVQKGNCCKYNVSGVLQGVSANVPYCSCNSTTYPGYDTVFNGSAACPTQKASFISEAGGCCYWKLESGVYVNKCETVANYAVCDSLHEGSDEGLKFSFYQNNPCIADGGSIICNSNKKLTLADIESRPDCVPDTDQDCYKDQNVLGNCCTLLADGSRECSVTAKGDCAGFWSYSGAVQPCIGTTLCSGVYFPDKVNDEYVPTTASLSAIVGSPNPLETLPSEPQLYQGGLYVGIFQPGSPVNTNGTMVYGNVLTGNPRQYAARGAGPGGGYRKWILIAAPSDITLAAGSVLNPDKDTSFYDGFYSTNQKITEYQKTIRSLQINGFSDWYIPSQDELAFYFNTISSNFSLSTYDSLSSDYYLTSTYYSVNSSNTLGTIADKYFVYVQSANPAQYGKVILMPQDNLTCKVRLFRRIYLGT
jgi:hypothetical protein